MSDCFELLKKRLYNKKCAVLGIGVSNLPLVNLLIKLGCCSKIVIYDKKGISELSEEAQKLYADGIEFVTGPGCFDDIDAGVIFRSPGIRPDAAGIPKSVKNGAVLTSETEQLLDLTVARTFAITGSDGKTTTSTLTGKFLEAAGSRVYLGGNIGTPLLDKCDLMRPEDSCVLELSSFQLMHIARAPMNAAITNVSPNHMDWHVNEEEYFGAKKNIVGENTKRLVVNANCRATALFGAEIAKNTDKEVIFFSSSASSFAQAAPICGNNVKAVYRRDGIIYISDAQTESPLLSEHEIRLPGLHNIENYMTAMALTYKYASSEDYLAVARDFTGVEHRLEPVRTLDGVEYINGSIDSSPTRTIAALSALEGRDIVIICGGYDKNLDYSPLAPKLCECVRTVVLSGATSDKIENALLNCEDYREGKPEICRADSFEDAVTIAKSKARIGGCVLLSPASASFDRFKNFAERGKYFKKLVNEL